MSSKKKKYDIFNMTNSEEGRKILERVPKEDNDFYLKVFYSFIEEHNLDEEEIEALLIDIKKLKEIGFRKFIEKYVLGSEEIYVNMAKKFIKIDIKSSEEEIVNYLEGEGILIYFDVISYMFAGNLFIERFKKIAPVIITLGKCNIRDMAHILSLLSLAVKNVIDWDSKIDFESITKSLEHGETIPVITHLNSVIDFSECQEILYIDYSASKEQFLEENPSEYRELFVNILKNISEKISENELYDEDLLSIYFDTLNFHKERDYNGPMWLKTFLSVAPIVLEKNSGHYYCDRSIEYMLKWLFKSTDFRVILSALAFSQEELLEMVDMYEDDTLEFVDKKMQEINLLELYKEYVEPLTESDYEEVTTFGQLCKMHGGQENFDKILEQSFNQVYNEGKGIAGPKTKIKVYVVPRKTE